MYLCTCKASSEHAVRLRSTCSSISEDATEFWEREKSLYCIHSSTIDKLDCDEFPVNQSNSEPDENRAVIPVVILSMAPLYAAAMSGMLVIFFFSSLKPFMEFWSLLIPAYTNLLVLL